MRLFFGLSLPDPARRAVAAFAAQAQSAVPGRYVPAENYHVTLAFLGEVEPQRLWQARQTLARCAQAFPAPCLTPTGAALFGRSQNGILVLRYDSKPCLDTLHDALISALRAQALPADPGPFTPHVTLARHARAQEDTLCALGAPETALFCAAQAHVFLSARDADGVLRYSPLFSTPFRQNL